MCFFGKFVWGYCEIMKDWDYWFFELVVIDKNVGGRGVVSRLLKWGLERVDRDGLFVYLEVMDVGEFIYEKKFGFWVVRRDMIDVGIKVIDVLFMICEF